MFEPCPTCGGSGTVTDSAATEREHLEGLREIQCPAACVGGRVVSESVIEEMARAMWGNLAEAQPWEQADPSDQEIYRKDARAAARVVLEHMEDNK